MAEPERRRKIEKECLRIEEDAVLGMKTMHNEKDALAARGRLWNILVTVCQGILLLFSAGTALDQAIEALQEGKNSPLLLGLVVALQILVAALEGVVRATNYSRRALKCKQVASEYDELNARSRHFREHSLPYCSLDFASDRLEQFVEKRLDINKRRPELWKKESYLRAQEGIRRGEAKYESDELLEPHSKV
jgi:hypothetical protein